MIWPFYWNSIFHKTWHCCSNSPAIIRILVLSIHHSWNHSIFLFCIWRIKFDSIPPNGEVRFQRHTPWLIHITWHCCSNSPGCFRIHILNIDHLESKHFFVKFNFISNLFGVFSCGNKLLSVHRFCLCLSLNTVGNLFLSVTFEPQMPSSNAV